MQTPETGKVGPDYTYRMNSPDGTVHNINKISSENDLGVTIDKTLSFTEYVDLSLKQPIDTHLPP
jgi:hypothetical protein